MWRASPAIRADLWLSLPGLFSTRKDFINELEDDVAFDLKRIFLLLRFRESRKAAVYNIEKISQLGCEQPQSMAKAVFGVY